MYKLLLFCKQIVIWVELLIRNDMTNLRSISFYFLICRAQNHYITMSSFQFCSWVQGVEVQKFRLSFSLLQIDGSKKKLDAYYCLGSLPERRKGGKVEPVSKLTFCIFQRHQSQGKKGGFVAKLWWDKAHQWV